MEGYFFAKDGVRAVRADAPNPQTRTGARRPAPTAGTRRPVSNPVSKIDTTPSAARIKDHEAVYQWLRSIPAQDRPRFLRRVAATVDQINRAGPAPLESERADSLLSFAILLEHAVHLGFTPFQVCELIEADQAKEADSLLGVRVDRMLADAAGRRAQPRRTGETPDSAPPTSPATRGLSAHWRTTFGRRGRERRDDNRLTSRETDRLIFQRAEPGRAG